MGVDCRDAPGGSAPDGQTGGSAQEASAPASTTFTASARRLGIVAAAGTTLLTAAYAVTLVGGLSALQSPQQPIGDPWFSMLEILILLLAPLLVALMAAIHAWAPTESKASSLAGLTFAGLMAGLTCSVHFVILTVARHPAFAAHPWSPLLLSFSWPSVAYALDILAWDVFFPLAVLFAAPAFGGSRQAARVRVLLRVGGALAFAGLSGVVVGDMRLRMLGVIGYVGVFPVATLLLALLFHRAGPSATPPATPRVA